MSQRLDTLPSVKQMLKLIVVLLLALIALSLVLEIAKLIMPLLVLGLLIAGGFYLFTRLQKS